MDHREFSNPLAYEDSPSLGNSSGALTGRSILVVDDFPEMTSLVADVFAAVGAKVRQVNRGADAIPLICGGAFDILILDLAMPEINGYMILRFLKHSHPESLARTLVLTATNSWDHHALAEVENYQVASLFKPFTIPQLLGAACRLLLPGGSSGLAGFPEQAKH